MTTREEFAKVVAYLSAAVNKPMAREQAEVYYELLRDLPPEALKAAAKAAVAESRYPTIPTVGTLRELALESEGPVQATWAEAWGATMEAVERYGCGRRGEGLASLPPVARRTAEAIGWRALCDARRSEADTLRAQFRDAYGAVAEREARCRLLPPLLREQLLGFACGFGSLPGPDAGRG